MLDVQMRRGLLDVSVLSVLSRGDSYGYKIIKDMTRCIEVSESTLYPILRRLEAAGSLTVYSVEHNGRLRKMYSITDAGREQIDEFLAGWQEIYQVYEFIKEGKENDKG
jgi:PadR family transcriptional regulator PadR